MASIYEKLPHFVLEKIWDKKTQLPETYKLQSNNSCKKIKAKVHQDGGKLGIEFTVNKTNPDFKKGAKKINLNFYFVEFENVLQGQYKTAWKQVVHKHFPELTDPENVPTKQNCSTEENFCRAVELFIIKALHEPKPQDQQYIYMMPNGNYNVQKKIKTSPIDHLHQWEEMMRVTGLLPVGNIEMPNAQLLVEWVYMTFHKPDRAEYVRSGHKLRNKMLQTLMEYFQSIHRTHENNGSLQCHQLKKVLVEARYKMRQELEEQFKRKMRHLANQGKSYR